MRPVVAALCMLGMLVVAPLGLRWVGTDGVVALRRAWFPVAALGVLGVALSRGPLAVALAVPYAVLTSLVALAGARRALLRREVSARELTALVAVVCLAVAGSSLVVERTATSFLGFTPGRWALTVAHFHFAGFAAALLAGLVLDRHPGPTATVGALSVPLGTGLVALGHFAGDDVELAGALALTVGLSATGWVIFREELTPDRVARALLLLVALAVPLTMGLAVWYAAGEAAGLPHPSISVMAATHGAGNSVAVGLASVLAWWRLQPDAL